MLVLVDGHNAMGALKVHGATHEARRRELLRRVAAAAPHATVYFDASNAPSDIIEAYSEYGMHVVYCRDREADAAILDRVRSEAVPGRLVVVSNDREVAGRAGQLGAQTSGVVEFFGPGPIAPVEGAARGPGARMPRGRIRFEPKDFGLPDEVDLDDPPPELKEPKPKKGARRGKRRGT